MSSTNRLENIDPTYYRHSEYEGHSALALWHIRRVSPKAGLSFWQAREREAQSPRTFTERTLAEVSRRLMAIDGPEGGVYQ